MGQEWIIAVAVLIVFLFNLGCYIFNENSLIWRGIACRKSLLLVSNRKEDKFLKRPTTWFVWDLLDAMALYTSPAVGTLLLALYRAFGFSVFVATIIFGNVIYGANGPRFFIYFTNWTFVLFGLTGLLGTILTARAWKKQRRPTIPCIETAQPVSLAPGWSAANRFYHLLLETVCAASIMLTIFYWAADYVLGTPIRVDNPFKHGVSAFLLLGDLALSRVPLASYHIQVVVAYGSVYLVFMWLYFAGTGIWVYRALNWSKASACIYYAACPLLLILGFAVMFAVASLREWFLHRCHCSCCSAGHERQADISSITAKPLAVSQLNTAVPVVEASMRSLGSSSSSTVSPSPQLTVMLR